MADIYPGDPSQQRCCRSKQDTDQDKADNHRNGVQRQRVDNIDMERC